MHYLEIRNRARELRRNPTDPERLLWQFLRGRKLEGFKFLRQHPFIYQVDGWDCSFYVADFYCHRRRLVVELDGGIHDQLEQQEKDRTRDRIMTHLGLNVLRIRNEELSNLPAVLHKIANTLHSLPDS